MQPLVTCMVPTYNRPDMLKRCVRMFNEQTYPNKEMIIIDDSETENTLTFPSNVTYVRIRNRRSIGFKRNLAVRLARGEYIAFWDDDDIQGPRRIANQVKRMQETQCDVIADANHVYYHDGKWFTLRDKVDIQEHLWWRRILMPSVMFKKSLMKHASFPNRYTSEDRSFFKSVLRTKPNLRVELWTGGTGDFVYVIHNKHNPWSRYMLQMISVTKPYSKHCLCVR